MDNKTYERCYICDRNAASRVDSIFASGLSFQRSGEHVKLEHGKPICNVCKRIAMQSLIEMDLEDPDFSNTDWVFDRTKIPQEVDNPNISWTKIELNENGTIKFPLPLKVYPETAGWRYHRPVPSHPLSHDEKLQVEVHLATHGPTLEKGRRSPKASRIELEKQINNWRWEDLSREKRDQLAANEESDHVQADH